MKKEKLNETVIGTILAGALVALAFWAMKKIGEGATNLLSRSMGGGLQKATKNVTLFLDLYHWNNTTTTVHVVDALRGNARTWFLNLVLFLNIF